MKILFLTESGKSVGFGHVHRCTALADGFVYYGHQVDFIVRGLLTGPELLEKYNIKNDEWFDVSKLNVLLEDYSIVVIDSYQANKRILGNIAQKVKLPVFLIDSQLKYYPRGIVLFPSVYADKYEKSISTDVEIVAGKEFILFNSVMWNLPKYKVKLEVNKIGISIGGYFQEQLLNVICRSITVVYPNVEIKLFGFGEEVTLQGVKIENSGFLAKDNYIAELFDLDIMIVNGGQSLNECLLVGIPTISLVLADNQLANSTAWHELGVSNQLILNDPGFEEQLTKKLRSYSSSRYRSEISLKSSQIINPTGSIAAADRILSTFSER